MEYFHHLLLVLVPSMMTMLVISIATVLYHARRRSLITEDNNIYQKAEKIPQENDERFATGKSFIIYFFVMIIIGYHNLFTRCVKSAYREFVMSKS